MGGGCLTWVRDTQTGKEGTRHGEEGVTPEEKGIRALTRGEMKSGTGGVH